MKEYLAKLFLKLSKKLDYRPAKKEELKQQGFTETENEPLVTEPAGVIKIKTAWQKNYEEELKRKRIVDLEEFYNRYS